MEAKVALIAGDIICPGHSISMIRWAAASITPKQCLA